MFSTVKIIFWWDNWIHEITHHAGSDGRGLPFCLHRGKFAEILLCDLTTRARIVSISWYYWKPVSTYLCSAEDFCQYCKRLEHFRWSLGMQTCQVLEWDRLCFPTQACAVIVSIGMLQEDMSRPWSVPGHRLNLLPEMIPCTGKLDNQCANSRRRNSTFDANSLITVAPSPASTTAFEVF